MLTCLSFVLIVQVSVIVMIVVRFKCSCELCDGGARHLQWN